LSWRPALVVLAVAAAFIAAVVIAATAVVMLRDRTVSTNGDSIRGSGVPATEHREVAPFSTVELAGASTVAVRVGPMQSVAVTADDNLVNRVTTTVDGETLIVAATGSFTNETPMSVTVSVPSLDGVTLSGSGIVTVEGVAARDFMVELSGTGTLEVSGRTVGLTAVLSSSGMVDLHDLVAEDVIAKLHGTGHMNLHAASTLDATLTGTGSIVYSGSPAVTTNNTGTGSIIHG
jgi:hypothetical protein